MFKRLFIGIPVSSDAARKQSDSWRFDRLLNQNRMSWVKPENWHITLFFLGDTPEERVPVLKNLIDEAFEGVEVVQTELRGAGVFPDWRNAKVFWLGLATIDSLIPAHNRLAESLTQNGFDFDNKPLKPHLTLARIKSLEHRDSLKSLLQQHQHSGFGTVKLERVVLFESVLTSQVPVYKPLYANVFG
ncbi:MAG: RNA 2',3'-cyclic phosphodiesterase [Prolixibacteraceae bacterium]|nr:RNA 2',3'-cyclic phosphodiesterase [Prolixibacteraceae bacterium]